MSRSKNVALAIGAVVLLGLSMPGVAGAADSLKEVIVKNDAANPVPVTGVGTTSVQGTVDIGNRPSVDVANSPDVGIRGDANTVRVAMTRPFQKWTFVNHCQGYLELEEFDPAQPLLIKRIYVSQSGTKTDAVRVETTLAVDTYDGVPPIVVQTPHIMTEPLVDGAAVVDFGDTGLYVDLDRNQADLGDVVQVYLDTCAGADSTTRVQLTVVGYAVSR